MSENSTNFFPMPRYLMRKNALEKILKKDNCTNKKLLEIGYGAGEVFTLYDKLNLAVSGFDFSELAYKYASEHCTNQDTILFKEKNKIPLRTYDYVIACEVLEHIENDIDELIEWKSYLNKTGKLIISVPAHQKRWGSNDIYSGHYRRYEKDELEKKFMVAGMTIDKIYTYDFPSCLILDKMRDASRAKKLKQNNSLKTLEEFTKTSGIERDFNPIFKALSHPVLQYPIIKFQQLFYHTDLGSAYILIASQIT